MPVRHSSWIPPLAVLALCTALSGQGQQQATLQAGQQPTQQTAQQATQQALPQPQHALTPRQRAQQQKQLEKELSPEDKKWLDVDVAYIITPQERQAFLQLTNEEEREQFIEAFWQRRNPNPDSTTNSFKEEYYERFAYANEHYSAGEPGWKTDRGRIYITWGKPDDQDNHDAGGPYDRSPEEGGGSTTVYPFEDWTYNYIPGIGTNVQLEFVDKCWCGDFELTTDPCAKDALAEVPNSGLTMNESMGLSDKSARFTNTNGTTCDPTTYMPESMSEFNRIDQYAKIFAPPPIKFTDLSEVVDHNITYNLLPFQYRTDFVKVTDDTVMVPITLQIACRNMTMKEADHVDQGKIDVYGRISTITGTLVDQWDQTAQVNMPDELLPECATQTMRYWHGALLKPGRYKVSLVLKDVNSPDKLGTKDYSILVPEYNDTSLSSSSVILADNIAKVPDKDVGTGQFILGDTKVDPVIGGIGAPAAFHESQSMGIWLQIYNLHTNKRTNKPSATIRYQIEDLATQKSVLDHSETSATMSNAADQMTIEKTLPLASLPPGTYRLTISVTDNLNNNTVISPHADFIVLR